MTNAGSDLQHECAVFLACRRPTGGKPGASVLPFVLKGLQAQSNRGQEGFGLAVSGEGAGEPFRIFRTAESVNDTSLFDPEKAGVFADFHGNPIIGHNRYATHGPPDPARSQPMQNSVAGCGDSRRKVIAFNGHIANTEALRAELLKAGFDFRGESDTEVLLQKITQLAEELKQTGEDPDYTAIFSRLDAAIDGACSLVLLDGVGNAVLYRHSNGIRPLELFETEDGVILAASETEAFAGLTGQHRAINPGEVFYYNARRDSWSLSRVAEANPKFCILELLYFGRPNSKYKGLTHHRIRRDIGRQMAETIRGRVDRMSEDERSRVRVMPVPNTAIPFALDIAHELDLTYEMGIERRIRTRAFINATPELRQEVLRRKFDIVTEPVAGKIVMVVDDTLIRRDTSSIITEMLKEAGAERVEWLICAPPFQGTCYYGIAVPSVGELAYWAAAKRLPEELLRRLVQGERVAQIERDIARDVGADRLTFLPLEGLLKALPGDETQYCLGCFGGIYPTPTGARDFRKARDQFLAEAR
jgi:amidophosphoribosyltransferase